MFMREGQACHTSLHQTKNDLMNLLRAEMLSFKGAPHSPSRLKRHARHAEGRCATVCPNMVRFEPGHAEVCQASSMVLGLPLY